LVGFNGGDGAINVSGIGSNLTDDGDLSLGDVNTSPTTGTLTASTGANATVDGDLYLANGSLLTVADAGTVSVSGEILIAQGSGSATATVSGVDTTLTSDSLLVGLSTGQGSLIVDDGGTVSVSDAIDVGDQSISSSGTITVSDIESSLTAEFLYVGFAAIGSLTVIDGATASVSEEVLIGDAGSGTITVSGDGSTLTQTSASNIFYVGIGGDTSLTAALTVTDDGTVSTLGEMDIGYHSSGTATLMNGTLDAPDIVVNAPTEYGDPGVGEPIESTNGGTILGSGEVDGDIENNGSIVATGGTLDLTGAVTGTGTMTVDPGLSGLVLDGAIASGQTVVFEGSGGPVFVGGMLSIGSLGNFGGTISNFLQGDTIDLTGVPFPPFSGSEGIEANFNSNTGLLTIDNVNYGSSSSFVGSLQFSGYTSNQTFALSSDGNSGTDITFGTPEPSVPTLADLSNTVYDPGFGVDGYTVANQDSNALIGYFAEEFQKGNQIVVAIRGTNNNFGYAQILNLVEDASWFGNSPNSLLTTEVSDAANFLQSVRLNNPSDNITITGHSLGGAVAQLLGNSSGYMAVGFNAPGAQQFETALISALAPAASTKDGVLGRVDENFRLHGDQISLAGAAIGPQFTVASPFPDNWASWYNNHSMNNLDSQIDAGASFVTQDTPLSLSDLATEVLLSSPVGQAIYAVNLTVSAAAHYFGFDPSGYSTYELTGDANSPDFNSVLLPTAPGVAAYEVSFQNAGASWSVGQTVTPGTTFIVPAGITATGVQFVAEDNNQNSLALPDGFIFEADFTSAGTFNGTLTESVACFRKGTLILTPVGQIPVEDLCEDDLVTTLSGQSMPIVWIGFRSVDCRPHPDPRKVWPVRIATGAFGLGQPHRDLWLSPDHAVFVDDVLIPIKCLINSASIEQIPEDRVTYYHIELAQHDVLLAEGLPAESYLGTDDRSKFRNDDKVMGVFPDFVVSSNGNSGAAREAYSFAPLMVFGPKVDSVKHRAARCTEVGLKW
jgi:T5SS/PEP-CTERM-associated repeat protein